MPLVIETTEDGPRIRMMSGAQIEQEFSEDELDAENVMSALPASSDINSWPLGIWIYDTNGLMGIKPVETVTQYNLVKAVVAS